MFANRFGFVGQINTHLFDESSIKYNPVHDSAQTLSSGCAYVPLGHFSIHLLLYPKSEGHVGHFVEMQDIVVGSAKVDPGHV